MTRLNIFGGLFTLCLAVCLISLTLFIDSPTENKLIIFGLSLAAFVGTYRAYLKERDEIP